MSSTDPTILQTIQRARELRRSDDLEESQALLLELVAEHPDDPLVLFEVGGAYDVLGDVEQAIPYYRRAIDEGLSGDELHECLICLGSCLRLVDEDDEAIEALQQAVDDFPERRSGRAFLALAHHSAGDSDRAMATLLGLLLETTKDKDILSFADTLAYYRDELDPDAAADDE